MALTSDQGGSRNGAMHRHLYGIGLLLLGAVFGVLAVTWTWPFLVAAVACFVVGFLVERGVLTRERIAGAMPFEVRWKTRAQKVTRPPALGVLDWEVAFEREGKRMQRALVEVTTGMSAVTEVMKRYGPRFENAQDLSAQQKVQLSQDFARSVRPHARRMEKAEVGARSAMEQFIDNYLKRIRAYPPELDLGPIRPAVASLHDTTAETLGHIKGYRDGVQRLRSMNLQQATNEVLDQLLRTAVKLVDDVQMAADMADAALTEIDGRQSTSGVSRAERRRRLHKG